MTRSGWANAADLHAAGVEASNNMRPALGERRHLAALRALDGVPASVDSVHLRARILISLAYAVSEQGRVEQGLSYLDEAEQLLPPSRCGVLYGQKAVLLRRTGRDEEALQQYSLALPVLDEKDEPRELARVLLNRAVLHIRSGRPAAARTDLARSTRVAQRNGFSLIAAKARHNLAMLDLAAGDLPTALSTLATVSAEYARSAPGVLPLLSLDRARVLLAAGLFREADADLAAAVAQLRAQGMGQDEAEALLARAEAALMAGRFDDARRWAAQARSRFARRRNARWGVLSDLVDLRATYASQGPSPSLVRRAKAVGERLSALDLHEDARVAALLAVRGGIALGLHETVADGLRKAGTVRRGDRLDTRVLVRLTRAEAAGRWGVATRHLSAGLADIHRHRAQVGCLDLQTGAAVHGRDLTVAGLRRALDRGRLPEIFAWAERSRAQALLLPAVQPPADDEIAAALADLRQTRLAIREAERAGQPIRALRTRGEELEQRIRRQSWTAQGAGSLGATGSKPVSMRQVSDVLGDAAMVVYISDGPTLRALCLTERGARMVVLGSLAQAAETTLRLRASLDARAGRALPARLAEAVLASLRHDAEGLDRAILAPVLDAVGDRPLIIVPTSQLLTVAWALLPGAAGRPVTVAASATSWYATQERIAANRLPAAGRTRVAIIAGPGNDRAGTEVRRIARLHRKPLVFTEDDATAANCVAAFDGADLAHVAAHGRHRGENPLFSAFELADGPLMGYDLQRIGVAPRTVVLSACDLGLADIRPGDESLGMTTALIAAGTATVIANVARVADDVAVQVMTGFHQRFARGVRPAAALAEATADTEPTGFVCFGAG